MTSPETEDVTITGDMIRLGQLLKFTGVAESGADAAAIIASGDVSVDGRTETRRGRQLTSSMVVSIELPEGPRTFRVV